MNKTIFFTGLGIFIFELIVGMFVILGRILNSIKVSASQFNDFGVIFLIIVTTLFSFVLMILGINEK